MTQQIHPTVYIHNTSFYEVDSNISIGEGTVIWRWTQIENGVVIGKNCMIGNSCYIGKNVKIGDNVRIQNGCYIPENVTIEDDVFIGPNAVFTNDKHPPSDRYEWGKILVGKRAVIGANSTILPHLIIGENSTVGAGSVVTRCVPAGETWVGNPAKLIENTL